MYRYCAECLNPYCNQTGVNQHVCCDDYQFVLYESEKGHLYEYGKKKEGKEDVPISLEDLKDSYTQFHDFLNKFGLEIGETINSTIASDISHTLNNSNTSINYNSFGEIKTEMDVEAFCNEIQKEINKINLAKKEKEKEEKKPIW